MSGMGWKATTLGMIADVVMGQSPAGEACNENGIGVPLLNGPTEFGNHNPHPVQFTLDPKKYAETGDLLFCVRGSTTGRMNWADQRYAIGRGLAALRHRDGKDFQSFLKGIIDCYLPLLLAEATGSTFPNVSGQQLNNLQIKVPDLPTQTRIAAILSALDDKIELNRQTNATLEAIAQAIFKEWFVDFRYPGATGEMQDSELGPIPKGWIVYRLEQLIESVSKTHKFEKNEVVFLNTSDIEAGKVLHQNYSQVERLPGQAKKSIQKFDILFTEIRPENKRFALIDFDADDYVVSTKLMVLRVKTDIHPIVIYNYLTCDETINWLQHLAESRSGTFPQITFGHVRELKLALPPKQLLLEYSNLAWANFQEVKNNEQQISVLSGIRDVLLPKLMSGEIEV